MKKMNLRAIAPICATLFIASSLAHADSLPSAIVDTAQANSYLSSWLDQKVQWMKDRLQERNTGSLPDYIDYYPIEKTETLNPSTAAELELAKNTADLYRQYFPKNDPSSYFGTFFECGHPWVKTSDPAGYQWDSLQQSGMNDPSKFDQVISKLTAEDVGLKSVRIGPNLAKVSATDDASWNNFLSQIDTIWKHGGTPTVSVAFFPSLKKWEVLLPNSTAVDYAHSYLLNPAWPRDMGELTTKMMTLLNAHRASIEAAQPSLAPLKLMINPVNEPETLAGFNRQFWHGAHANWSSPESMRYYVPSLINIAKANVQIRLAAEKAWPKSRILFMHNEAMTPNYYPSHHGFGRFAVSKFMLGDDVLMTRDFRTLLTEPLESMKARLDQGLKTNNLNEVDWSYREFVFGSWNTNTDAQEKARALLTRHFMSLKNLHLQLQAQTGKTMKTDNILQLDYYYQTEFVPNIPLPELLEKISANHGQELKRLLGFADSPATDEAFLKMVRNAGGDQFTLPNSDRAKIDFKSLLTANDGLLFDRLVGLQKKYDLSTEAPYRGRQAIVGLSSEDKPLEQTDDLMNKVLANGAVKLMQALDAKSPSELTQKLNQLAQDNHDGGGLVAFEASKTLHDTLDDNDRAILNRIFGLHRNLTLGFGPPEYPRQVRAGIRYGFYHFFMEYVNALHMRVAGVGESGTPFYVFAPLLHDQMMTEYVTALKSGIYGTQYSAGPAIDTKGWVKSPLALSYDQDHEVSPSGIYTLDLERREWLPNFIRPIRDAILNAAK